MKAVWIRMTWTNIAKHVLVVAASITAASLFATAAHAQASATAAADASVTIVAPLAISKTADLAFGTIVANAESAGTVTVAPSGARSLATVTALGSGESAATYNVTGDVGRAYSVDLPTEITLGDGGANSMTVDDFTHNASLTLTGGAETFGVGATLNVGANQPAGTYTGTFNVTVAYN